MPATFGSGSAPHSSTNPTKAWYVLYELSKCYTDSLPVISRAPIPSTSLAQRSRLKVPGPRRRLSPHRIYLFETEAIYPPLIASILPIAQRLLRRRTCSQLKNPHIRIAMALPQLFGVIPTGCPIITTPTTAPAPTSLLFNLPARPFSHIVVVLLPGITLPPDTAAAVYLASSPTNEGQAPEFKFLGGLGPGKESAIFKVGGVASNSNAVNGEVDMDAPDGGGGRGLVLGISVESCESVNAQMAALTSSNATLSQQGNTAATPGNALVRVQNGGAQRTDALVLAQRIIKNAFNFLASFAGNVPVPGSSGTAGVEVVPLKAFENWWAKFETRVKNDPEFLMRDAD